MTYLFLNKETGNLMAVDETILCRSCKGLADPRHELVKTLWACQCDDAYIVNEGNGYGWACDVCNYSSGPWPKWTTPDKALAYVAGHIEGKTHIAKKRAA